MARPALLAQGLGTALVLLAGIVSAWIVPSAAITPASAEQGALTLTDAWATRISGSSQPAVYLTIHNHSSSQIQIEAVITPDATATIWVLRQRVHTIGDIFNAAECGQAPSEVAESADQLRSTTDLIVPADGELMLAPGLGRIELQHAVVPRHSRVPLLIVAVASTGQTWDVSIDLPFDDHETDDSLHAS